MLYMNDYDLDYAERRFNPDVTPNRARLVAVVRGLAAWANSNSDGWCYWPKPAHAARKAMEHIQSTTNKENDFRERNDISNAEYKAALRPIKSFLTRQGAAGLSAEWEGQA